MKAFSVSEKITAGLFFLIFLMLSCIEAVAMEVAEAGVEAVENVTAADKAQLEKAANEAAIRRKAQLARPLPAKPSPKVPERTVIVRPEAALIVQKEAKEVAAEVAKQVAAVEKQFDQEGTVIEDTFDQIKKYPEIAGSKDAVKQIDTLSNDTKKLAQAEALLKITSIYEQLLEKYEEVQKENPALAASMIKNDPILAEYVKDREKLAAKKLANQSGVEKAAASLAKHASTFSKVIKFIKAHPGAIAAITAIPEVGAIIYELVSGKKNEDESKSKKDDSAPKPVAVNVMVNPYYTPDAVTHGVPSGSGQQSIQYAPNVGNSPPSPLPSLPATQGINRGIPTTSTTGTNYGM